MPQFAIIPTITQINTIGNNISIKTFYQDDVLPDTIMSMIAPNSPMSNSQDGVLYSEGDGVIQMKNSPANIDYALDGNGNLILICSTGDENNYSIDIYGNLIYTSQQ